MDRQISLISDDFDLFHQPDEVEQDVTSDETNSPSHLLSRRSSFSEMTPIPLRIMISLCLIIFSEPLSLTILFPFVFFMVRDFHVTDDEKAIGYYVGMIASAFSVAQFVTGVFWGQLSDRIGRRPVLLIGLVGNTVTILTFGVSKTLTWAILSRCLCGALNGNVAVAKTVLGEITDSTNRAYGFSLFGFTWAIGMVIGPTLGGFLSFPATTMPALFGQNEFLKTYPYFLPCLVSALVSCIGYLIGLFSLPETNCLVNEKGTGKVDYAHYDVETMRPPLPEGPSQVSTVIDESLLHMAASESTPLLKSDAIKVAPVTSIGPVTKNCIACYAALSFTTIIMDEVFPIWASSASTSGGLGFTSYDIGLCLSITGGSQVLFQFVMLRVLRSKNALSIFRKGLIGFAFVYPLFPLVNSMLSWSESLVWPTLLLAMAARQFLSMFCFTAVSILVLNMYT